MPYVGNQPTSVAFLTDTFNGNGSTTAFTLSAAPATSSSILVAVSGVLQDPSTYSTTGTTLNFSAAPPSGTGNISVRFLGIPASGVVTTAYRTQTEFTATAGQTTFSVPSYTVGYIDVYRNGVLLGSADFTATNGTTVVLAAGASAGDLIETVSFYVSSVLNAVPTTGGTFSGNVLFGSGNGIWNTSGNVGIGTTSPTARLGIPIPVYTSSSTGGMIRFQNPDVAADSCIQSLYVTGAGSDIWLGANSYVDTSGAAVRFSNSYASSAINLRRDGTIDFSTNSSSGAALQRMRIDSSGNVGINTSSPSYYLDVIPNTNSSQGARIYNVNSGSSAYSTLYFGNNNSPTNSGIFLNSSTNTNYGGANSFNIWQGANAPIAFQTNNTERMRIAGGGGVSIGTTAVNGLLTVNSSVTTGIYSTTTGAFYAGYFATNGANAGIYGESNGYYAIYARTTTNSYGGLLAYDAPGTYYAILAYGGYSLYTNGSIYVNGTVYASDARLKENVVPISNALDKIKQLNPVSFDWKADSAKGIGNNNTPLPDYGMIAQEVEQVLPDLVHEATVPPKPKEDNTKLSLEDELGSCKGVDYSKLIPFLTKAIQELNDKVEAQAAEIQALKGATQ